MMKRMRHTIAKNLQRTGILLLVLLMLNQPVPALAQEALKPHHIDYTDNEVDWWEVNAKDTCGQGLGVVGGDTITRFLQALADQENGGKVTGDSGTGAKGKYQYIDGTWRASAQTYYPPALSYANANLAPEAVQDAVAYLEYATKFKQFNGDLFKLAVSHFYPAGLTDPSKLDIVPRGNVLTPRQYAQAFIQRVNSGAGSQIPIKAQEAPDFAMYAAKVGQTLGTGTTSGTCTENGIVAGDIVKTALGLAWPDKGHGKEQGDATGLYQQTMPNTAKASGDDPWSDCGVFVATVMIATGADPNYTKRSTSNQLDYVMANKMKFEVFETPDYTRYSDKLLPGDILLRDGHTYIFTGPYKGSDGKVYNSAAASLHDHVPQADNWYPGFVVVRKK